MYKKNNSYNDENFNKTLTKSIFEMKERNFVKYFGDSNKTTRK